MRKKFICPRCETFVETDIDVDGYAVCPKCENDIYLPYFRETSLQSRVEELEAQLAEAKARLAWTPVSERLPEDGEIVLIIVDDGGRYLAIFDCPTDDSIARFVVEPSEEFTPIFSVNDITHWMPLPEAPKEDE